MKKLLALLLLICLAFGAFGCADDSGAPEGGDVADDTPAYKIGIITMTVSQNEEDYRAAEAAKNKYGDMIVHLTMPDRFVQEQETFISQVLSLASDPKMKAIMVCQAVPGTTVAYEKVREIRPDIYLFGGAPHEDPMMVASKADISILADEYNMGNSVIDMAVEMGAETFVHYSFPRHMSYPVLAARRELFEENSKKYGITYVDITAPDPTGDAGVSGTQQFILEDVPRAIKEYGPNTAIFGTNCSMQEPIIKMVVEHGGMYVLPCCPSPYHGYPSALGISIPDDKKADIPYILEQITAKCADAEMTGRVSTWPVPVNYLIIVGGIDYMVQMLNENENIETTDIALLKDALSKAAGEIIGQSEPFNIKIEPFFDLETGEIIENFLMLEEDYFVF